MDIVEKLRNGETSIRWPDGSMDLVNRVAAAEIERLRRVLRYISRNTCCDTCREAALVARAALGEEK